MAEDNVIIRFDSVSYSYDDKKVILDEVNFSVRRNSIVTIMGQNGAGKSTIFKLLLGTLKPQQGKVILESGSSVGIAEQMIPKGSLDLDIVTFFKTTSKHKEQSLRGEITALFKAVGLDISIDKKLKELSGGQKARLLLAYALITNPDVLLLDEPTNNLDSEGIEKLTAFLMNYKKTCIVISHDADFLNCFTDGVLNLDSHTHKVEQFVGNYYDVLEEIAAKLERDNLLNSRLERSIKDRFTKINKLGGKSIAMSRLATRIRKDIDEDRGEMAEGRTEDKTIPDFQIPNQEFVGFVIKTKQPVEMELVKGSRVLVKGPNGIGKSTLLKAMLMGKAAEINPLVRVGYYSQEFSELDYDQTAFDSLLSISQDKRAQMVYESAARFLLSGTMLKNRVGSLSEGQKGLLCYARFMMQRPGILILDEPTNHINFRHIPVIARAINSYEGPVILVSHLLDFVAKIKNIRELDLESPHNQYHLEF
jgi:ATP-binding cassette subfamily F protein 3